MPVQEQTPTFAENHQPYPDMKKTIIFIILLLYLCPVHSQEQTIRILTEKDLSAVERKKYRKSAEDFLKDYYRKLINSNDNIYVMETMVSRYMDSLSREYQPEFTFVRDRNAQPVKASEYLMVLASELHGIDTDFLALDFRVSDISILPEFYAPDFSRCFIIAQYTLSLYGQEKLLFSRRCEAYCLFPEGKDFMEVRLLQVRPLDDIVVYRGDHGTAAVNTAAGNPDWESLFDYVSKPGFDKRRIVRQAGKYGVIAEDGTIIVPVRYDKLGHFNEWNKNRPIRFKMNGMYGYVSTTGVEIVPAEYDFLPEYPGDRTDCEKDNRWGVLDSTGRVIIPVKYELRIDFNDSDWGLTRLNGRVGYVHKDGKLATNFIFSIADVFKNGRAMVADKYRKVGFLGTDGKLAVPCRYKYIWNRKGKCKWEHKDLYTFDSRGIAIAMLGKRLGLIDSTGRQVTPFKYKKIIRMAYSRVQKNVSVQLKENSRYYRAERKGFKGWLDCYGNEYTTERQCLEAMLRIIEQEQRRLYEQALEYNRKEQYGIALGLFKRLADEGDAKCMAFLGMYHYNGLGTQPDTSAAVKWYGKAAEKGIPMAMTELGMFLYDGEGIAKDRTKAVSWFTRAADAGDGRGMLYLADCYYKGLGTRRDITKALDWYEKAVAKNVKGAKLALAVALYDGTDKPENHIRAFRLLSDPEMADNTKAAMYLGKCHYYGQGTPVKYRTAREYFLKSEKDYAESRYFLGWIYEHGQGVRRNVTEAVKWYGKCTGHRDADKRLADLKRKIRK